MTITRDKNTVYYKYKSFVRFFFSFYFHERHSSSFNEYEQWSRHSLISRYSFFFSTSIIMNKLWVYVTVTIRFKEDMLE